MTIAIFTGLLYSYDNKKQFLEDMSAFYQACHGQLDSDGFSERADAYVASMKKKKKYEY